MALGDLTSVSAVENALDEFDQLGREGFLAKYGFGKARRYFVRRDGRYYDSKAIVGAAMGFQDPAAGPLTSEAFSGGEHGAKARLEALGFEVVPRPALGAADSLPLRDALSAALAAQQARAPGEWSDDLQKAIAVTLPNAIRELVGGGYRVRGSAGAGNQAEIPWVAILPPGLHGASEGRYVVYLFTADGSRVYLSLSQAVTGHAKGELGDLANQLRADASPQPELLSEIALGGLGDLAKRYELATAYALGYEVTGLPAAAELERDLLRFLRLLGEAGEAERTGSAWIFQAAPTVYAIDRALRELPAIEWTVRQHRDAVKQGDRVYLWRSGPQAGVVAIGSVTSEQAVRPPSERERPYYLRPDLFADEEPRVDIRIERVLSGPLGKERIVADPVLAEMTIIRTQGRGTNFRVTPEQDEALQRLIGDDGAGMLVEREPFTVDSIAAAAERRGLVIEREVYASIFAALESGKHVILTGPPGTAKTTLAEAVAEAATLAGLCDGHLLTTATADWTTYETIGGLKPDQSGQLLFARGHFLLAIEQNQWLVIDELNRSNFDRAFGQLFTVLSWRAGQLPYTDPHIGLPIVLRPEGQVAPVGSAPVGIPGSWRGSRR